MMSSLWWHHWWHHWWGHHFDDVIIAINGSNQVNHIIYLPETLIFISNSKILLGTYLGQFEKKKINKEISLVSKEILVQIWTFVQIANVYDASNYAIRLP